MQNSDIATLLSELQEVHTLIQGSFMDDPDLFDKHTTTLQTLSFADQSESGQYLPPHVKGVHWGKEAANIGIQASCQVERASGQPALSVLRAIGLIPISKSTAGHIHRCNSIRQSLQKQLTSLNRCARSNLLNHIGYGSRLVLKQLYRQIPIMDESLRAVRSCWITSGSSSQSITKDKLLEMLRDLKDSKEQTGQSADYIQADMMKVAQFSDSQEFHIKRPSKPHVRYNIYLRSGDRTSLPGHLPLFYFPGTLPVSYRWLSNTPPAIEKPASDSSYLIKWMGIKSP